MKPTNIFRFILQLHRNLYKKTGLSFGERFKTLYNYISELRLKGKIVTRFPLLLLAKIQTKFKGYITDYSAFLRG